MGILWTIIIGFIVGMIAKFIMPGKNEPKGVILTTIWELSAPLSQLTLARPSGGTGSEKRQVGLAAWSAPYSFSRSLV